MTNNWDITTGQYCVPTSPETNSTDYRIPEDAPEPWLSHPGGSYFLGMTFHFAPYNYPKGDGTLEGRYYFADAPFYLSSIQNPYNSWQVSARLKRVHISFDEHWNWLPGIMIVDTASMFTLPKAELAEFGGTEWTDNEPRMSCGLQDLQAYYGLVNNLVKVANRITGPGWAGWPFGQRQLAQCTIAWVSPSTFLPEVLALASPSQVTHKYQSWYNRLYRRDDTLGAWEVPPKKTWDYRQALKFLYQAQLMLDDGFTEMALSAAIASLENATAEVLLFLLDNDNEKTEKELRNTRFLDRFDRLLPRYNISLPQEMFDRLKQAYFARNGIVHGLRLISEESARQHLGVIEETINWFWEHIGDSSLNAYKDDIPF